MTIQAVFVDFQRHYLVTTKTRSIQFVVAPLLVNGFNPVMIFRVDDVLFTDGQDLIPGREFLTIEEKQ